MPSEKTILIEGTEQLARGELDNLALVDSTVVLEQLAGRYMLYGCYTSTMYSVPPTSDILVSWNADTPNGTVVEIQARVLTRDEWSPWLNFGKWSPYIERCGTWMPESEQPYVRGSRLVVPGGNAVSLQLRAYLYTKDETLTPKLRMICASACPKNWSREEGRFVNREIRMPAYSQLSRAPIYGGMLSGPTTLAAMMNRYGQDIIPEELALISQDEAEEAAGENPAFMAAAAGCFGYPCWLAWTDLAALRREIRQGNTVMVRVNYAGSAEREEPGLPWLECATGMARGHWLAVRGFAVDHEQKAEMVLVCDPLCGADYGAERAYRLDSFLKAMDGVGLYMRRRPKESGTNAPKRLMCELKNAEEPFTFQLMRQGKAVVLPVLPKVFVPSSEPPTEELLPGEEKQVCAGSILAFTLHTEKAFATTAHKRFRFSARVEQDGSVIRLPEAQCVPGTRVTLYYIDCRGTTYVAERTL